ncbi:MAG: sugar ABC transporter substrate-binding protein [Halanaerobium sp. MSAO_Bac5]|nr:MAG: sugar ABC transporter substrate-binding protein [Halanaerobium sp. MSAO_Bac5]
MFKKTKVLWVLMVLILAFSLNVGAETIELDVWVVRDNYQIDLTEWNEANPNIEINFEVVPWEQALNRLIMSASSNRAPDVAVLDRPWVGTLGGLGHLTPLDSYIDDYYTEDELNDYIEASWEFAQYDGTTYAMPFTVFGRALFYRADWFEEAGLDAPETWEDVVEAGKVFTDPAQDKWGLSVRGIRDDGTTQGWLPIFAAMGGEFDGQAPQINSEAGIKALELYRDLVYDAEIMSPETVIFGSGEARGLFLSGNAAMAIMGSHIAPAVVNNGIEYGDFKMTHIPVPEAGMEKRNVATGFQWAVHEQSEHKDAAFEFIKYATDTAGQFEFNVDYMEAVRLSVYDIPEYREAKPWVDFILDDMEGFSAIPAAPQYSQMSQAIQNGLQEMLNNPDADAEAVAAEIQAVIDPLF